MLQKSILNYFQQCKKKLGTQLITYGKRNGDETSSPAKKVKADDGLLDAELIQATVDRLFVPASSTIQIDAGQVTSNSHKTPTKSPVKSDKTPTNSPVKSSKTPTNSPVKSSKTPTKSPTKSRKTSTKSPTKNSKTPTKSPVKAGATPTKSPAKGRKTSTKSPTKGRKTPTKSPTKNSKTPTKSPTKGQSGALPEDAFERPVSPASQVKRKLDEAVAKPGESKRFKDALDGQQSILKWAKVTKKSPQQLPDLVLPVRLRPISPAIISSIECQAKRRLFGEDLDEVRNKLKTEATGDFWQKLKEFQESMSSDPLNLICTHQYATRAQAKRRATADYSTRSSPTKFLEAKLSAGKSKSPVKKQAGKSKSPIKKPASKRKANSKAAVEKANRTPEKPAKNASPPSLSPLKLNSPSVESETKTPAESPNKPLTIPLAIPLVESATKPTAKDRGLDLPKKYLQLAVTFSHLETVVTLMYNRQETCTFDKAKQGVQKLTKKDFDLSHLAQILTIYPNAYKLNYERLTSIETLKVARSGLQLVIKPNVLCTKIIPVTSRMRMNEFNANLLAFAKKAHSDYLRTLDEPVSVSDDELVRWHPSFVFPNISEAELPRQPVENSATRSIRDFWSKLKIENGDPKPKVTEAAGPATEGDRVKIKKGVLKGLSQSFLDRVKQKAVQLENKKAASPAPEVEKKINDVKRLPEFVRTVQSLFTVEKKKSILLGRLIEKCCENLNTYSSARCTELVHLTNELLPDWLLILKTGRGTFIKINSRTVLKSIYDRLECSLAKLEQSSV